MLILTRSNQKRIVIGHTGEIVISVLAIKGNHVRLGFQASEDIPIHREEIFLEKQAEAKQQIKK